MLKTTESFKREILVYKYKQGGTISLTFATTTNEQFFKGVLLQHVYDLDLKKRNYIILKKCKFAKSPGLTRNGYL